LHSLEKGCRDRSHHGIERFSIGDDRS